MSKFFKIFLAVIGLLILWALTLHFRRSPIEQDLSNQVKAALSRPDFSQVAVSFDGRDGTMTGTVSSQALADEAESIAKKIWGVRIIDNQLNILIARADVFASIKGYFKNGKFMLSGALPDQITRQQMIQKATTVLGKGKVVDSLSVNPDIKLPARFMDAITLFWKLKGIEDAGFSMGDSTFVLNGKIVSEDLKNRLGAEIKKSLAPLNVQNKLQVKPTQIVKTSADAVQKFFNSNAIEFEIGSSLLPNQSRQILDQAYELLNQAPQVSLEIAGHTDNTGNAEYNMRLSKSRAIAVRLYLLEKEIAPERLSIKAYGETQPKTKNDTQAGRQRNRRVEMVLK